MSTYTSVVISPEITTRPVFTSVSQATRPPGSLAITASRTPSEIWSAILSGWPSVTDSEVKRNSLSDSWRVVIRRGSLAATDDRTVDERDPLLVLHAEHRVADPDGVEPARGRRAGPAVAQLQAEPAVVVVLIQLQAGEWPERHSHRTRPVKVEHAGALELERRTALAPHHLEVRDRRAPDDLEPEVPPHHLAGLVRDHAPVAPRYLAQRRGRLGARRPRTPAQQDRGEDEREQAGRPVQRGERQHRRVAGAEQDQER